MINEGIDCHNCGKADCFNCGEDEEESKDEKIRALLKAIEDNTIDVKIDEKYDEEPVVPLQYIAEELEGLKK